MRLTALAMGLGMALGLAAAPQGAAAQEVVAQMWCDGALGDDRLRGLVRADMAQGPGGISPTAFAPFLERGAIAEIPGALRFFGQFQDIRGNLVSFEVFLDRAAEGTGLVWFGGARDDGAPVQLVMADGGFTLVGETGDEAPFTCIL